MVFLPITLAVFAQNKTALQERIDRWKNDMEEFQKRSSEDVGREALIDSLSWFSADKSLEQRSFVVEADAVSFKNGTRVIVNSITNFISVKGDRGVIQISPSAFSSGPNGMGGITVDGNVSGFEMSTDRRGNTHVTMNITGRAINARVDMTLYEGSNEAYVTVTPNFNSRTVRLEGKIVPYENSRTVEGMTL